jgi:hypothetical protein
MENSMLHFHIKQNEIFADDLAQFVQGFYDERTELL